VGPTTVWKVWKGKFLAPKAGQEKFTTFKEKKPTEINEPRKIFMKQWYVHASVNISITNKGLKKKAKNYYHVKNT
jgi:hypothetical protein